MNWFTRKDRYDCIIEVTPELATEWLTRNTRNRKVAQWHVKRLAKAMTCRQWMLLNNGIAFNSEGTLLDGQHRLLAVILSGATVRMRVYFNQPDETLWFIDSNQQGRDDKDVLTMIGTEITKDQLSTLRRMLSGMSNGPRRTLQELSQCFNEHRDAISFAFAVLPSSEHGGIAVASIRAVLARAFYSCEHDKLRTFAAMLQAGAATADEPSDAVRLLIKALVASNSPGQKLTEREKYAKCERALFAFLNGETLNRLHGTPSELFELPEPQPTSQAA